MGDTESLDQCGQQHRYFFPAVFHKEIEDYGRVYQGDRVLMAVRNTLFIAGYGPLQSPHHSYLFNIEKYRVEMTNFIGLKEIQSPWGKVMERSGLRIKILIKGVKSPHHFFFGFFFLLQIQAQKNINHKVNQVKIFLVLVLLSASVKRCFVSCMQDFSDIYIGYTLQIQCLTKASL